MIIIFYHYWNKTENKWKATEKHFVDPYLAIRFCWSMKNKRMILIGWCCDDPEDNTLMISKINMAVINGWR